jgi:hypothetical protein
MAIADFAYFATVSALLRTWILQDANLTSKMEMRHDLAVDV